MLFRNPSNQGQATGLESRTAAELVLNLCILLVLHACFFSLLFCLLWAINLNKIWLSVI